MNHRRLLWILVVANIFLAFASAGAEGFFAWTLPASLANYHHERFAEMPWSSFGGTFHFVVLAVVTLCAFASWIGLLSSWRFARRLYVVTIALSLYLTLISGPSVTTSIGAAFRMLDGLVSGAVLGLVYFTDLARQFESRPAQRTAASAAHVGTGPA